jgi:hypothetical protein
MLSAEIRAYLLVDSRLPTRRVAPQTLLPINPLEQRSVQRRGHMCSQYVAVPWNRVSSTLTDGHQRTTAASLFICPHLSACYAPDSTRIFVITVLARLTCWLHLLAVLPHKIP